MFFRFPSVSGTIISSAVASVKKWFPKPVVVVMGTDDMSAESSVLGELATVVACQTNPDAELIAEEVKLTRYVEVIACVIKFGISDN